MTVGSWYIYAPPLTPKRASVEVRVLHCPLEVPGGFEFQSPTVGAVAVSCCLPSVSLPHFLNSLSKDQFSKELLVLGSASGRNHTKKDGVTITQMVKTRQRKGRLGYSGRI